MQQALGRFLTVFISGATTPTIHAVFKVIFSEKTDFFSAKTKCAECFSCGDVLVFIFFNKNNFIDILFY